MMSAALYIDDFDIQDYMEYAKKIALSERSKFQHSGVSISYDIIEDDVISDAHYTLFMCSRTFKPREDSLSDPESAFRAYVRKAIINQIIHTKKSSINHNLSRTVMAEASVSGKVVEDDSDFAEPMVEGHEQTVLQNLLSDEFAEMLATEVEKQDLLRASLSDIKCTITDKYHFTLNHAAERNNMTKDKIRTDQQRLKKLIKTNTKLRTLAEDIIND